jgi:hypothetical protein
MFEILVGKPEGKRPRGRPRRRWKDTIAMDLRDRVCEGVNWMHPAHDKIQWRALVNTITSLQVV